jgi:hypothetical protein
MNSVSITLFTLLCGCSVDEPVSSSGPVSQDTIPAPVDETPQGRARALIEASPFAAQAQVLLGALGHHVVLIPTRSPMESIPVGASHLAGSADLPPGMDWPRFGDEPMALLAQIDLAAVAPHAPEGSLPPSGLLHFFWAVGSGGWGYDAADAASFAVRYHEGPVEVLVRTAPPAGLPEQAQAFEPCSLAFEPGVSLPGWQDQRYPKELDLKQQLEAWYELSLRVTGLEPPGGTLHHLLGHPQLVQGDPRRLAAAHRGGEQAEWNLLLQLETDELGPGWMWGDVGTVYVLARDEDIQARRFEEAWLVAQGH